MHSARFIGPLLCCCRLGMPNYTLTEEHSSIGERGRWRSYTDFVAPTLFLICGLPGSGKTTYARSLERDSPALRLCPDEWMETLYGSDPANYSPHRSPVEAMQWKVAEQALRLGMNVILEYGFWSKAERLEYRFRGERAGASVELILLDLPLEELWARLRKRNTSLEPGTLPVTRKELETWWAWFEKPTADEF